VAQFYPEKGARFTPKYSLGESGKSGETGETGSVEQADRYHNLLFDNVICEPFSCAYFRFVARHISRMSYYSLAIDCQPGDISENVHDDDETTNLETQKNK
jgi:hypothetical protein